MIAPDHELHELIETASSLIDSVFAATGNVLPMYHIIETNGHQYIMPAPSRDKDASAAVMRIFFAASQTQRYVFISEAWILNCNREMMERVTDHGSISDHPQRQEVVMFAAEDRDMGMLLARRAIIRRRKRKPQLGPLEFDTFARPSAIEGRLVGLLAGREKPQ